MWGARGVWSDDWGYPVASDEGVGVEGCHDVRLGEVVLSVGVGQHLGSARGFPITLLLNGGELDVRGSGSLARVDSSATLSMVPVAEFEQNSAKSDW